VKNAARVKYNVHSRDMVTEIPEYAAPPVDLDDADTSEAELPYSAFLPPQSEHQIAEQRRPRQQGRGMAGSTGRHPRQPGTRRPNRCRWTNEKCENGSCWNESRCGDECRYGDECRRGVRCKCGDGRLRPSSERSERATRSHNHDRQSSCDSCRSNPTSRFPENSAARRTPTKPAPARAPFEAWESRTQLRTQAARNRELSSEGAQDYSPPRKRWVDARKVAQTLKGRKRNPRADTPGPQDSRGGCPHMHRGGFPT